MGDSTIVPRTTDRPGWTRHSRRGGTACAAMALLFALGANAANVRTTPPYGTGTGPVIPVILTPASGDEVASLQFRLQFDTSQFSISRVEVGAGAAQAGKDVIFAEHSGYATVIVAGLNQETIPAGRLATIYLEPLGGATLPVGVDISSPVISDPMGNRIDFTDPPASTDPGSNSADPESGPGTDKGNDTPDPEVPAAPVATPATPTGATTGNRNYYGDPSLGGGSGTLNTNGGYADNTGATPSGHELPLQGAAASSTSNGGSRVFDPDGSGATGGGPAVGGEAFNLDSSSSSSNPRVSPNRIGYRPASPAVSGGAGAPVAASADGVSNGARGPSTSAQKLAMRPGDGGALAGAAKPPSALGPLRLASGNTAGALGAGVAALAVLLVAAWGFHRWRRPKARR